MLGVLARESPLIDRCAALWWCPINMQWRGRSNSGLDVEAPSVWSGELQTDRAAFENAWGRCQSTFAPAEIVCKL